MAGLLRGSVCAAHTSISRAALERGRGHARRDVHAFCLTGPPARHKVDGNKEGSGGAVLRPMVPNTSARARQRCRSQRCRSQRCRSQRCRSQRCRSQRCRPQRWLAWRWPRRRQVAPVLFRSRAPCGAPRVWPRGSRAGIATGAMTACQGRLARRAGQGRAHSNSFHRILSPFQMRERAWPCQNLKFRPKRTVCVLRSTEAGPLPIAPAGAVTESKP
jgi:hypothetical protein